MLKGYTQELAQRETTEAAKKNCHTYTHTHSHKNNHVTLATNKLVKSIFTNQVKYWPILNNI